jgi:ribonuclease P protein component
MARYTLSKAERLSSLKAIGLLFESGASLASGPVRLIWRTPDFTEGDFPPIQVMFSVSKKRFSRAVDRNRIKRLLRECYRLRKPGLYENIDPTQRFHLALLFTGNEMPDYAQIQKSVHGALDRWLVKIKAPIPTSNS